MNRKEAIRQWDQTNALNALGISDVDAEALRRISMQLSRWGESLCNDTEEDEDGKAYRYCGPMMDTRYRVPNRGQGALRRLAVLATKYKDSVWFYYQSDPRGASIYVGSVADMPADISSNYTRGLAVW